MLDGKSTAKQGYKIFLKPNTQVSKYYQHFLTSRTELKPREMMLTAVACAAYSR